MRKELLFLSLFSLTHVYVYAAPISLGNVIGNPGLPYLYSIFDNGAESAQLSADSSHVTVVMEVAGYSNQNSFGIYGFTIDTSGAVIPGNLLTIFSGNKWIDKNLGIGKSVTLIYNAGVIKNLTTNEQLFIGNSFGFFIQSPEGLFYSHKSLNPDNADHFLTFDVRMNPYNPLVTAVICAEDLFTDGIPGPMGIDDEDYNDLVISMTNTVFHVSEPAVEYFTIFSAFGLLLASFVRRKPRQI